MFSEPAGGLKIQQHQEILARAWKPYMKELETMYTDSTCYESEMRYLTDPKLLWEGVEKANLVYKKRRKRTKPMI